MGGGHVATLELLGDAEVEQLDPAIAIDQQVGRLEVAMHDQVAMRVTHRIQHLQEQHRALAQAEGVRIAPAVDRHAVDPFHHEVRLAVLADATVQQDRDVGMLQPRQDLAFAQEAFTRGGRIGTGADQLERGPVRIGAVAASNGVHRAHAAVAEDPDDLPHADAAPEHGIRRRGIARQCFAPMRCVATEGFGGTGIGVQQDLYLPAQFAVVATQRIEPAAAILAGQFRDFVEDRECAPTAFDLIVVHACNSASRKARALRQSRRTVRSLSPSICAISASS